MAHDYRSTHPIYGTHAHCDTDAGQAYYCVAGSSTHILLVEIELMLGRSVDEVVADPHLGCKYARRAVQGIANILAAAGLAVAA